MVTSASPGAPRRRLPLERLVVTSQVHGVSGCGNKRSRQSRACSEILLLIDSFLHLVLTTLCSCVLRPVASGDIGPEADRIGRAQPQLRLIRSDHDPFEEAVAHSSERGARF